jgi:hypothetical protein
MAMIELGREPSRRELNLFGAMLLAVAGLAGALVRWRFDASTAALAIWSVGGLLALLHLAFPVLRRPIYFGWMYVTYPIGWVISHAILAVIFYLVITPTGLLLRSIGWNPLQRGFDREAETYWTRDDPHRPLEGYFRQY